MERQLRAILAMDVVGFSKMMSEDEENTLRVLTDRRKVVDQIINEHGGRIFNTAGDSVIAEFASPVKAAECAVQIQNKNSTINKDLNERERMTFRAFEQDEFAAIDSQKEIGLALLNIIGFLQGKGLEFGPSILGSESTAVTNIINNAQDNTSPEDWVL